jgi:hypothetical protein
MTDLTRTDRPDCTERPVTEETLKAPTLACSRPTVKWWELALWVMLGYDPYSRGRQLKEVERG